MKKPRVIFLTGPTAVGKSEAAARLAKKIKAQIISCDSMQVYKGMDVITSKPPPLLRKKIKHHLISILSPKQEFDVSRFRKLAVKKIEEIIKRKQVPVLVGGTGFYISVLLDGIFEQKAHNQALRQRLYQEAQRRGSSCLYRKLARVDPEAAEKIHPNDAKRIIRALEVFQITGVPISVLQKQRKGLADKYDIRIFCLNMPREQLYKRIDERVDKMFGQGLVKEIKKLLKLKLSKTASCAIGVKELNGFFDGAYDLGEAKSLIKRNTRRYAKRQLSWFRKDKRIEWINIKVNESAGEIAGKVWKKLS